MKVLLFGATGIIGEGVLRECLLDGDVETVLSVSRTATGQLHPKLREVLHEDVSNLSDLVAEVAAFNACFFCLGVSSSGMSENDSTGSLTGSRWQSRVSSHK